MQRGTVVMCEERTAAILLTGWNTRKPRNVWVQVLITGLPARFPIGAVRQATAEERERLNLPERVKGKRVAIPKRG